MKFRLKSPSVVEAVCWTGLNYDTMQKFEPTAIEHNGVIYAIRPPNKILVIKKGEWLVKGVPGETHVMGNKQFNAVYERL